MTIPYLTPLPQYPSRTVAPETWVALADAFVAAEFNFVNVDMNTEVIPAMNSAIEQVNFDADEAAQAAAGAALDRAEAFNYKNAAELAASNAATSENNAASSATNAITSAENAATSENNAASSATNATNAAELAQAWADNPEDVEVEPGKYSAYHWAEKAAEAVSGGIIDDNSIDPSRARSSENDSIGNFDNINVTANTSINILEFARIIAEGSSVTVTLPTSPSEGQMIMVGNLTNRSDHVIAVGSIPVKGQDAGGSIIIDKTFYTVTLKYVNATYGWEII